MQFKNAVLAAVAAATVSALPQTTPIADSQPFNAITIRSGSAVQNSALQAAQGNLFVNVNSQNASCDADTNSATFYIKDEELLLYAQSATPQTIFVDRSGMGQGNIGYVTGAQPLGENWETKGWTADDNELKFKGTGLQACPGSIDGGWSLWLEGVAEPGFNQNCTGVIVALYASENPIGCLYTE